MPAEPADGAQSDATGPPPHPLGHPVAGLAVSAVAALLAYAWAWLWLRAQMADWAEVLGAPMEVPTGRAVDFGLLTGSLALLAWLLGARTRLRPGRAVAVVAVAVLTWTIAGYALFAADYFPSWPAFEGPFVTGDAFDFAVRPTWMAFAGPVAVLLLTGLAASLGAYFRGTPSGGDASPWGHALVALVALLGVGAYTALQVLVWPSEVLGSWPATELLGWPFVALALAGSVAWATSGRGRGTGALAVLAALGLLGYASSATIDNPFMIVVGVGTVAIAAAHRPFARTLHQLVA